MLNNLGLGINLNVKGNAESKFGSIGNAFNNFYKTLPPGIQEFGNLIGQFAPLAIGIGGAVIALQKLGRVLDEATEKAGAFQYGMAEVSTLLSEKQMPLIPELSNHVLNLSEKFGKAAGDMKNATYQAISAGVEAREVGIFLEEAGKLAVGGITDMETSVDGLSSIKNAWGLSMEEMGRVSDQMFVAMRAGKTTIGELSRSIGQVAPIAAQMNFGLDQVLSMTATLTKGGLTTSESITGIRQAMVEVMKQSPQFIRAAKKYGIAIDQATITEKGFANWLSYANEKITAGGGKMSDLFRSVQGLTAVLTLTGKGMKDNAKIMESMQNATGATKDAFNKMADTYQMSVNRMTQSREKFLIKLGQIFLPVREGWVALKTYFYKGLTGFVSLIDKYFITPVSNAFAPFFNYIKFIVKGFTAFAGTVLKYGIKISGFYTKFLLVPVKLAGAVIQGFVNGYNAGFEKIAAIGDRFSQALSPVLKVVGRFSNMINSVFSNTGFKLSSITNFIADTIGFAFDKVAGILEFGVIALEKFSKGIVIVAGMIPRTISLIYQKMSKAIVSIMYTTARVALAIVKPVYYTLEKFGKVEKGTYRGQVAELQKWKNKKYQGVDTYATELQKKFEDKLSFAVQRGMENRDKEREIKGKDKTIVNVNNEVKIGNKKIHESKDDWEEMFLVRNFVPVR